MRPHILSPKHLNNFDIRDIQPELRVGLHSAAVVPSSGLRLEFTS
jgi:hypothetical protein